MARLAQDRDTYLTPEEIAAEALRQFDAGGAPPSIRGLAAALKVAPTAIYHHFPSRARIVDAAVELVWREALAGGMALVGEVQAADPADVLVGAALATRRAFVAHPRLAAQLAATTESSELMTRNIALLAGAFERLGLTGDEAAVAFHAYASFTIGSVLFVTARIGAGSSAAEPPAVPEDETRAALEAMTRISVTDPARDEELFVLGLRRLVAGFTPAGGDR